MSVELNIDYTDNYDLKMNKFIVAFSKAFESFTVSARLSGFVPLNEEDKQVIRNTVFMNQVPDKMNNRIHKILTERKNKQNVLLHLNFPVFNDFEMVLYKRKDVVMDNFVKSTNNQCDENRVYRNEQVNDIVNSFKTAKLFAQDSEMIEKLETEIDFYEELDNFTSYANRAQSQIKEYLNNLPLKSRKKAAVRFSYAFNNYVMAESNLN